MADRKLRLFLSHAWEDKEEIAHKLYEALKDKFDVWYDTDSLQLGDSLTFNISDGLTSCDYGVVVLSETYIQKKWTKLEFAALIALEPKEKTIILPIWHNVTREQVVKFSPILADRIAILSHNPIDVIVLAISSAIWGSQKAREVGDPLQKSFSALADLLALIDINEELGSQQEGVKLVNSEVSRLFDIFGKRLERLKGSLYIPMLIKDETGSRTIGVSSPRASRDYRAIVEVHYENPSLNTTTGDRLTVNFSLSDDRTSTVERETTWRVFSSTFLLDRQVILGPPTHGFYGRRTR